MIQQPTPEQLPELPKDREHIRILVIMHYVYAGLIGLGVLFLGAHFLIMRTALHFAQAEQAAKGSTKAMEMDLVSSFMWIIYGILGVIFIAKLTLNLLSARAMSKRKGRVLSLITAGLNCLNMPFGLVLGIFTFIVLFRDSVRRSYGE